MSIGKFLKSLSGGGLGTLLLAGDNVGFWEYFAAFVYAVVLTYLVYDFYLYLKDKIDLQKFAEE